MVHIAIYNETAREVEYEEAYADDELTDVGENAAEHNAWRLEQECLGRGTKNGEWKVYKGPEPFSWPESKEE